jgi:holo-[acyl-carrier protein] synthase
VIIGFGADLCDIRRIADALERHGERFPRRLFTLAEREYCDAKTARAASYAKRFAAKEACAKALGVGISHGVGWLDMGVVNLPSGMPTLELTGGAEARLRQITPPGTTARVHLTLTDEEPYAQAMVLIEAAPC